MQMQKHHYGPKVRIFNDPTLNKTIADASVSATDGIATGRLVEEVFGRMIEDIMVTSFPLVKIRRKTRMNRWLTTTVIDPNTEVISVSVLRAGDEPSLKIYRRMGDFINPKCLHRDHILMSRIVNVRHEVTGAAMNGFKPSGPVDDKIVVIGDPMGATGGSLCNVVTLFKSRGAMKKIILAFMIATPDCIAKITAEHPDVEIWIGRLDRGNSSKRALRSTPGKYPEEESGLTPVHYIVPGAAGMGEIMNNALD